MTAWIARREPVAAIAGLRRRPGPLPADPLPVSFLKHADEQTVVAVSAVSDVVASGRLGHDFTDWGVLAAPRYLGRWLMAASLLRYREEGPWGVSPHLIPHRSLHSVSGTISQALRLHGPNFGVGGGPGGEAEALLAALALLHARDLPGVWLILTRVDPELPPDVTGEPPEGCHLEGLVLALQRAEARSRPEPEESLQLTLRVGNAARPLAAPAIPFSLACLRESLSQAQEGIQVRAVIDSCVEIELSSPSGGRSREPGPLLLPGPRPGASADERFRRSA